MLTLIVDWLSTANLGQLAYKPITQFFADGSYRVSCDHIPYSILVENGDRLACIGD